MIFSMVRAALGYAGLLRKRLSMAGCLKWMCRTCRWVYVALARLLEVSWGLPSALRVILEWMWGKRRERREREVLASVRTSSNTR